MNTFKFPLSLPGVLRLFGALALIGGGLIYMLQGLDTVDLQVRNWAWLAFMFVLSVGGLISFSLLQDRKGSRLFFLLAALVIPVQFSQLGGMVFNYFGGGVGNLFEVFQFTQISPEVLALNLALSLVGAIAVSFASFSILTRPHARWLVAAFITANLFMLVPIRALPFGLIILFAMAAIIYQLETKVFSKNVAFKTFEGICSRLLCTLPLLIVFIRAAFHQHDFAGLCLLSGLFAVSVILLSSRWLNDSLLKEFLIFAAWLIGLGSSLGMSAYLVDHLSLINSVESLISWVIIFTPLSAWSLWVARYATKASGLYRSMSMLISTTLAIVILQEKTSLAMLFALTIGLGMSIQAYRLQARAPLFIGILISALSFIGLVILATLQVEIGGWLLLAIAGVILVALSSVAEKYGRIWLDQSKERIENFCNWPA